MLDQKNIDSLMQSKQQKVDLGFNYHVYIDGIYAGVKPARKINSTVYDPMLSIAVQKITFEGIEPPQHIL